MVKFSWQALGLLLLIGLVAGGCNVVSKTDGSVQTGTISGYVYDPSTYDYSTKTFKGTPEATVIAAAAGATYVATTDASGHYSLSGLPAGTLNVTAFKNGNSAMTIVTDQALVNFFLSGSLPAKPKGTAVITGTLTGAPAGTPASMIDCYACSKTNNSSYSDFAYIPATGSYTISHAPDEGETYVIVRYATYEGGNNVYKCAYGKVNTAAGATAILNLAFSNFTTLGGTISLPAGFYPYYVSCSIAKGYQSRGSLGSASLASTETSYLIKWLPQLAAGDSLGMYFSAQDSGGNYISHYFYNITGTTYNADLSSQKVPTPKSSSPADNANLAGVLPSFAWEACPGSAFYSVSLRQQLPSSSVQIWSAYTTDTSVSFPAGISGSGALASGATYIWSVVAVNYTPIKLNDLPGSLYTSVSDDLHPEFSSTAKERKFTY
jgi:hypothetical protein